MKKKIVAIALTALLGLTSLVNAETTIHVGGYNEIWTEDSSNYHARGTAQTNGYVYGYSMWEDGSRYVKVDAQTYTLDARGNKVTAELLSSGIGYRSDSITKDIDMYQLIQVDFKHYMVTGYGDSNPILAGPGDGEIKTVRPNP